jgi:hypothetical protein
MKSKYFSILLGVTLLAITSCGQESSSSTASSTIQGYVDSITGQTVAGTSSNSYTNIDQVRAAFNAKSLESGVTEGTYIYHTGSSFGGSSNYGVSGGISVSGCFFGLFGDCSNSGSNSNQNSELQNYLNNGRMLKIGQLDQNSSTLSVLEAIGVSNNNFTYNSSSYSRTNSMYLKMLGLDDVYDETKVNAATIEVRDNNNSITSVNGIVVEHIKRSYVGISSIKRYVLTTNLPVIANPIAILDGNYNIEVSGLLKSVGLGLYIKSIVVHSYTGTSNGSELLGTDYRIQL